MTRKSRVFLLAHEGGGCQSFTEPNDLTTYDPSSAIFKLARALPARTVDAIVAGHSHQGIAQHVAGIPIMEAYANGRGFGRIDLLIHRTMGTVSSHRLFPPQDLCTKRVLDCQPGPYEGKAVFADQKLQALIQPALAHAKERGQRLLGIDVIRPKAHHRSVETALGNWWADRILEANPKSDLAILNGGGVRAGLPQGPLTYDRFYRSFPFDNAFASFHMPTGYLRRCFASALNYGQPLPSIAELCITADCIQKALQVPASPRWHPDPRRSYRAHFNHRLSGQRWG